MYVRRCTKRFELSSASVILREFGALRRMSRVGRNRRRLVHGSDSRRARTSAKRRKLGDASAGPLFTTPFSTDGAGSLATGVAAL